MNLGDPFCLFESRRSEKEENVHRGFDVKRMKSLAKAVPISHFDDLIQADRLYVGHLFGISDDQKHKTRWKRERSRERSSEREVKRERGNLGGFGVNDFELFEKDPSLSPSFESKKVIDNV